MEVRASKGSINDFAAIIMPFEDENGLYPLCTKRSKSFLSIVNKPILEYQIEYLLNFKFNQIAVVVKKDEYSAFERICTKFVGDANIIYLPFDDFENMNTFEILKKAAETYFNNNFLVLDGNLLTDFDVNLLFEFHILRNSKFTAVFNQPKQENKIKDGSKTNIKCSEIIAVPKYEQEHIVFSKFVDKNAKFEGIDIDKDVIEKFEN
ncbi:hypothetical protein MHBO_002754 [Bonamia ostreae]|uniref:Translation initiation factor eIF2B subunit gamma n=1 Tax=Bonamia ostreae TaxID=126728 RepID=A0ABV2APC4_9EUKA